jgi:hypothetical protein
MPVHLLRANNTTACDVSSRNLRAGPSRITCSRVADAGERRRFEMDSSAERNIVVFDLADDYSFGVLQSSMHAAWVAELCSTRSRSRYELRAFRSFPWPQQQSLAQVVAVTLAGLLLRTARERWPDQASYAQFELDQAVMDAYGFDESAHPVAFLLELNQELATREARGEPICGPGLPPTFLDIPQFFGSHSG